MRYVGAFQTCQLHNHNNSEGLAVYLFDLGVCGMVFHMRTKDLAITALHICYHLHVGIAMQNYKLFRSIPNIFHPFLILARIFSKILRLSSEILNDFAFDMRKIH